MLSTDAGIVISLIDEQRSKKLSGIFVHVVGIFIVSKLLNPQNTESLTLFVDGTAPSSK